MSDHNHAALAAHPSLDSGLSKVEFFAQPVPVGDDGRLRFTELDEEIVRSCCVASAALELGNDLLDERHASRSLGDLSFGSR